MPAGFGRCDPYRIQGGSTKAPLVKGVGDTTFWTPSWIWTMMCGWPSEASAVCAGNWRPVWSSNEIDPVVPRQMTDSVALATPCSPWGRRPGDRRRPDHHLVVAAAGVRPAGLGAELRRVTRAEVVADLVGEQSEHGRPDDAVGGRRRPVSGTPGTDGPYC